MVLVVRSEDGTELGRASVVDGEASLTARMEWVRDLYLAEDGEQITPLDGDRWLEALAREFQHPSAQAYLER